MAMGLPRSKMVCHWRETSGVGAWKSAGRAMKERVNPPPSWHSIVMDQRRGGRKKLTTDRSSCCDAHGLGNPHVYWKYRHVVLVCIVPTGMEQINAAHDDLHKNACVTTVRAMIWAARKCSGEEACMRSLQAEINPFVPDDPSLRQHVL